MSNAATTNEFLSRQVQEYEDEKKEIARLNASQQQMHVPKTSIERKHKVILFGHIYRGDSEIEEQLYSFTHQRVDGVVTEGWIPAGFVSRVPLDASQSIELSVRKGNGGPEFMVKFGKNQDILGDWNISADAMWTEVLTTMERKALINDDILDYLDCDPFVLFGIDDPITQKALKKLERYPALLCRGAKPDKAEWFEYLGCPENDKEIEWVVQAFAETELPTPWTCYKGTGSIVCYIKQDTGHITWKHPFYDYFTQLRDFCYKAPTEEEIWKVRVHRLLWCYEAACSSTSEEHDPLVSPEYVEHLADIFGYSLKEDPYLCRTIKAYLKSFAKSYRATEDIEMADIKRCAAVLSDDCEKDRECHESWQSTLHEETRFQLQNLAGGSINCIECNTVALSFCLECKDYLCLACFDKLHQRGARRFHAPFRLIPCALCQTMPAKLHCTFTDKSLCHECYAMRHIKVLPPDAKENPARRINYKEQYDRYAQMAQEKQKHSGPTRPNTGLSSHSDNSATSYESVIGAEWHPFYDARGVKYHYNFKTCERMRQCPQPSDDASEAASEAGDHLALMEATGLPFELDATNRAKKKPSHLTLGLSPPREIREPFRVRIPHIAEEGDFNS